MRLALVADTRLHVVVPPLPSPESAPSPATASGNPSWCMPPVQFAGPNSTAPGWAMSASAIDMPGRSSAPDITAASRPRWMFLCLLFLP
jgi:hypothetical protein